MRPFFLAANLNGFHGARSARAITGARISAAGLGVVGCVSVEHEGWS